MMIFSKKNIFIISLVFLALLTNFGLIEIVFGQSAEVSIVENEESVCTFENTKMAILKVIKNITGIPSTGILPTFYIKTAVTPSVLDVVANKPVDRERYKYTGQNTMLIDPGSYNVLETVPSDFNWLMKNVSCAILPACGDEICDTSTEVGESCSSCPNDCNCSRSSPVPPILPDTPTGKRIVDKNGIEDVEFIVGRTTECIFDNELMALKIVSDIIGGDGTETFDYNIKGYDSKSPSMKSNGLSVVTNQKIREDKVRGDEWSGSDGIYLTPAVTSYIITEEISDGWTLNSVVCEMKDGKRTGIPTIYSHGIINVTIEPDKVTTCTFKKTKKGEIKIVKNAKNAKGGEKFDYDINFVSTNYLPPGYLSISTPLPKATIKVDKNGLGSFLFTKFTAVSDSGTKNRIMTSDDSKEWIIRESPKDKEGDYIDNDWQSVAYGKGMFVAVSSSGTGNRVMTSDDGKEWIIRESPKDKEGDYIDNDWQSVAYGKGMFVAVSSSGTGNRVMTSDDGIDWTIQKSVKDNNWKSVVYGKGLFVAVSSSEVMTSIDGRKWTAIILPVVNDWTNVKYGKGMFMAVSSSGTDNRVMTSLDGKEWTIQISAEDNNWQSVAYFDSGLYPGLYRISENLPKASSDGSVWFINKVKCVLENGDSTGTVSANGLKNVSVYAGKTTTCTFDNVLRTKTELENQVGGSGGGGSKEPKRPSI